MKLDRLDISVGVWHLDTSIAHEQTFADDCRSLDLRGYSLLWSDGEHGSLVSGQDVPHDGPGSSVRIRIFLVISQEMSQKNKLKWI